MSDRPPVVWPDPADDLDEERGEDPETHLLPNLARLRAMTVEERDIVIVLVADWRGPLVDLLRERVEALREGREVQ